jgi:hypothetical protein
MKKLLLFLLLAIPFFAYSQSATIPIDENYYEFLDRMEIKSGHFLSDVHTAQKPYLRDYVVKSLSNFDTIDPPIKYTRVDRNNMAFVDDDNTEWINSDTVLSDYPILDYFYRTKADLYSVKTNDFMLKLNPVISFAEGKQVKPDENMFINTRGVDARGWVAKKIGFYLFIGENQTRYPSYVQAYQQKVGSVPGDGYYKAFHGDGVDYLTTHGYIDFKAAKFITVTFGRDKNFIGDGYRSLFLSDFSEDYLFLKLNTQVWKFNYTNIFADLTADFLRGPDRLLAQKYAAFHHLSLNVTRFLNVGLFESVIFNRTNGYDINYLNPIIFYRAIEQGLGSPDNAFIGGDFKVNFLRHFSVYSQLLIDDYNAAETKLIKGYWGDKYGVQIGVKYVDAFTIRNLDLQIENNIVVPYTYTHNDTANYANYNQPLADPFGANFNEKILIVRYQPIKNLFLSAKIFKVLYGQDTIGSKTSNWGSNINFITTDATVESVGGNFVGQGIRSHLTIIDLVASYMIRHNVFIDLEYLIRNVNADTPLAGYSSKTTVYSIGIRMNIAKKTYDY